MSQQDQQRQGQQDQPMIGGSREGGGQRLEGGADRRGEPAMVVGDPTASRAGLAGEAAAVVAELLAKSLGRGATAPEREVTWLNSSSRAAVSCRMPQPTLRFLRTTPSMEDPMGRMTLFSQTRSRVRMA